MNLDIDFIYPEQNEREKIENDLINVTVSYFKKGVEHTLSYENAFLQRVNYDSLLADIAYQLGMKGAFLYDGAPLCH